MVVQLSEASGFLGVRPMTVIITVDSFRFFQRLSNLMLQPPILGILRLPNIGGCSIQFFVISMQTSSIFFNQAPFFQFHSLHCLMQRASGPASLSGSGQPEGFEFWWWTTFYALNVLEVRDLGVSSSNAGRYLDSFWSQLRGNGDGKDPTRIWTTQVYQSSIKSLRPVLLISKSFPVWSSYLLFTFGQQRIR